MLTVLIERFFFYVPLVSSIILGIGLLLVLKRHTRLMEVFGEGTKAKKAIKKMAEDAKANAEEVIIQAKSRSKEESAQLNARTHASLDAWLVKEKANAKKILLAELDQEIKAKKSHALEEIRVYKKFQEETIKKSAADTLTKVLDKALVKSLTKQDQDILIMSALESAKRQKVV